ncbi:MAG TPA: transporter, partial [Geobacterales bacterium]|nr:transporter [Geobacterales bacterium]
MIQHLADNPLLLLFLVAAIGYPLGRVRIKGVSLGVAAVLFAGLAAGAIDPALKLPEIIYQLGLVLFVYTVGLASGHTFLSSLRRDGLRPNLLVALTISVTALAMVGVGRLFTLSAPSVAGLFTGTLTNTPALAAALDTLRHNSLANNSEQLLTLPVVAYSLAYPASILGMIAAVTLLQGRWRIDYGQEVAALPEEAGGCHDIANATLRVTNPEAVGVRIADLQSLLQCHVL